MSAATRLFIRDGYRETSVARLMAQADLTHGGFYAHFRDKAALLDACMKFAFDGSRRVVLGRELGALRGSAWVAQAAARYLSDWHTAAEEGGCPVPALGREVSREEVDVRARFAAEIERTLAGYTERLDGDRARAIQLLAVWSGGLNMARAVDDPALAAEILEACRAARQCKCPDEEDS